MSSEFKYIVQGLQVLHALEVLEYHNKTLLYGSDATRSEYKQDELLRLISRVRSLSIPLDVADAKGDKPKSDRIGFDFFEQTKSRQG